MGPLEKKRPVIFAGENHLITLYRPGGNEAVAGASCWRCTYSAHGEGFVLAMWCDPRAAGAPGLPQTSVYADNAAMGRMVMARFNQYFAGFQGRGLAEMEPQPARFFQQADGRRLHRITCVAADVSIELLWQEIFDAALEIFDNRSGPEPYDVSAVICPCRRGTIAVNGAALRGEVRVPAGPSASSAFLAFSETWVARG
ncbi:MAG: hypothetical protein DIU80_024360 [Chloroflexota bacterium]